MEKTKLTAGADNRTPSIPQYFSWINNTNEGSTEEQTLINLDFFRWLKDRFGMEIRIYAWDAGNFDGAAEGYGNPDGEKFRAQYPNGYKPLVEKAASVGCRLGLWGSPDGYGDDARTEKERFDFFVHLCRDYGFAEFKLDGVCGRLRPEKAGVFAEMLRQCRKYSPDLIVLNHRLDFYEAEPYITTFLWNGAETYTDVLSHNDCTAMHHRAYMFHRGYVPGMQRMSEDHGVCISSAVDYFDDELIYQAFNRSLILAPEMYGNPWFLRDDEFPRLARIYNLHRRVADILVDGMPLPESYGCCAAVRGSGTQRFLTTGNDTWEDRTVTVHLDESIGLAGCERVTVISRYPYESLVGTFAYGETVDIIVPAFRAVLTEIAVPEKALPVLTNCAYEVIHEDENGVPDEVKIIETKGGRIDVIVSGKASFFTDSEPVDIRHKSPVFLQTLEERVHEPANGEALYEASVFAADNDALEARVRCRSGETAIPEVKAARDAFFGQKTYRLRGCECAALFDGSDETFYDTQTKTYQRHGSRDNGGCLRVDFGRNVEADCAEIVFFAADEPTAEVSRQNTPVQITYGTSFDTWKTAMLSAFEVRDEHKTVEVVRYRVHTTYSCAGKLLLVRYPLQTAVRYLRMDCPPDRIYHVRLMKNGENVTPETGCRANNIQSPYGRKIIEEEAVGTVALPSDYGDGAYLAVAFEGEHGDEQAYCCMEIDGRLYGCPERAPDFKANQWEHRVTSCDRFYTYYFPLTKELQGKEIRVHALFCDDGKCDYPVRVYLCEKR